MKKIEKKDLGLDMFKTILKLYEVQEQIIITAKIKNPKARKEYLYKNGEIYEK